MADIFQNATNPYTRGLAFEQPKSLLESKAESVAAAESRIKDRLDPAAAVQDEINNIFANGLAGSGGSFLGDIADLGQASVDREFENISNFATGDSNPNLLAEADERSGVRPQLRQEMQEAAASGIDSLANARINFEEGDYLSGIVDVGKAAIDTGRYAPELIADNVTGSLASGIAGTVATAGIGAIPTAGKKIFNVGEAVGDVAESVGKAVTAKKAKSLAGKAATRVGQVSLSTAAVMQQNEEAYIAENGESSSALHKAVNAPAAVALMMFDRAIFLKALPSRVGPKAAAKSRKEFVDGVKAELSPVPKKFAKEVAKRVYTTGLKVAAVAGAEATQEYLQTWHSILQAKMDDASIESALKELRDENNIDEANYSALVGAIVGGGAKAGASAPGVVAGTVSDAAGIVTEKATTATKAAVDKATQVSKDATTRAGLKLYSAEERAAEQEKNLAAQAKADTEVANKQSKIDIIEASTTVADLKADLNVAQQVEKIQRSSKLTDENLTDPEIFTAVKDKLISEFKGDQAKIKAAVKASSTARVLKDIGTNVANESVTAAQKVLNTVAPEQLVKTAIDAGVKGIDGIKSIKSSTARGVLDLALREGATAGKTILEASKNLKAEDLKTIIKAVKPINPELAKGLIKNYENKLNSLKAVGTSNATLTTEDNISTDFELVSTGEPISKKEAPSVFKDLTEIIEGKIGDLHSLEVTEKVLAKYKDTEAYKSGTNRVSVDVLEGKLEAQARRVRKAAEKAKAAEPAKQETTKEAEKSPDSKPEPKTDESKAKVDKKLSGIEAALEGNRAEDRPAIFNAVVLPNVGSLAKGIKAAGIKSIEEVQEILSPYPHLSGSVELLDALKVEFPATKTEVVMSESTDKEPTTSMSREDAIEAYKIKYPRCPI